MTEKKRVFFRGCKIGNVILDVSTLFIVIIIMAVAGIIGYQVFNSVNTDIQASDMTNESKAVSGDLYGKYANLIDNLVLMAFIFLLLAVIVTVFVIDTHPIFFFISAILLVSVFVVGMLLANVYDDFFTGSDFAQFANAFTFTTWLMTNLVPLMIASGFLIMIILFIKAKI